MQTLRLSLSFALLASSSALALPVQTWVPNYAVESSKTALQAKFGDVRVDETITHIALQYWNLKDTGGIEIMNLNDEDVTWFRDYGRPKGIKSLLTLVNLDPGFNWNLTRKACYGPNATKTIRELLDEMDRLDLDGIDLDVEGEDQNGGPFTADDRKQWADFVNALGDSIHARGKVLHVSTYPTEGYGAPKPSWWGDWKGRVDLINPMGYDHTAKNGRGDASYSFNQKIAEKAGYGQDQFVSGLPVWMDSWKGFSALEHVTWIADTMPKPSGLAIWAIHHIETEGTWQDPRIWTALKKIKDLPVGSTNAGQTGQDTGKGKVIDDMKGPGNNIEGGMWYAGSDYWSRGEDKSQSSKVWTLAGDYDMAHGEGVWGKIQEGYWLDRYPAYLGAKLEILGPVAPDQKWAEASVQMEFLPRDCSKYPEACWEIQQTGTEADYSAYKNLVVGLKCTEGQSIKISYTAVANRNDNDVPSQTVACSGNWEDHTLALDPEAAKKMFRMNISLRNDGTPLSTELSVAGVALDRSVVAGITPLQQRSSQSIHITWDGQNMHLGEGFGSESVRIVTNNGQLVWQGQAQGGKIQPGPLSQGIYWIQSSRGITKTLIQP